MELMPVSSEIVGLIPKKALGAGRGVVPASGELRFIADPGEPSSRGDGRQDGGGRIARRQSSRSSSSWPRPLRLPAAVARRRRAGAMAAGLGAMVADMSRGKKAYVQYEPQLSEAIGQLARLREELKAAIDADAESYNSVMKAYKAAKGEGDGDAQSMRR